jgi:hypothetical protein
LVIVGGSAAIMGTPASPDLLDAAFSPVFALVILVVGFATALMVAAKLPYRHKPSDQAK